MCKHSSENDNNRQSNTKGRSSSDNDNNGQSSKKYRKVSKKGKQNSAPDWVVQNHYTNNFSDPNGNITKSKYEKRASKTGGNRL